MLSSSGDGRTYGHKRYGPKKEGLCPLLGGGAGSPSNTTWSGPRPTSVPSGILIHPAIWPQQTWAENWGRVCAPFSGEGSWAYLCANCHLDPSSCLATIEIGQKFGELCPLFWGRGAGYTSNMLLGPRPTSLPSGILIHPAIWPQQIRTENWGGCAPLEERELGPHLTQCGQGRGLTACQV